MDQCSEWMECEWIVLANQLPLLIYWRQINWDCCLVIAEVLVYLFWHSILVPLKLLALDSFSTNPVCYIQLIVILSNSPSWRHRCQDLSLYKSQMCQWNRYIAIRWNTSWQIRLTANADEALYENTKSESIDSSTSNGAQFECMFYLAVIFFVFDYHYSTRLRLSLSFTINWKMLFVPQQYILMFIQA